MLIQLGELNLNGREIKNNIKAALALAKDEKDVLSEKYVNIVYELRKD